ncbi:MAG: Alpha/beta hydrolase family protein [Rhodospirillales bacterium]|nr:Alpha/beta hydrolase family protein [Rhodospirillales bacterium]
MEAGLGTEQYWTGLQAGVVDGAVLVTDSGQPPWGQVLLSRDHILFADEPAELGGQNTGPAPTDIVLMALGGCTAITLRMYAARKEWVINRIAVRLRYEMADAAGTVLKRADFKRIERIIEIDGPLDDEQRARLMSIADKCPVHQILTGSVAVRSTLAPSA